MNTKHTKKSINDTKNNRQLQVAIVSGSLSGYAGGAPRSIALHAQALNTQNIKVSIFTGYSRKYPLTPELFGVQNYDIMASRLWGPSVLGLALKSLYTLARRAREYDIIHLNGHWNLTTFIGAAIARINRVPYVITTRGHLGTYDFKHLWFLKLFLYPFMEIPNLKHAACVHVCSDWEQHDSQRALKHAKKVVKLPNAIDFSTVLPSIPQQKARKQLDLPQNKLIYLFLSRIAPDKSPAMLLKSWAKAKLPTNATLVMAGPATPAYKKHLTQLAEKLNIVNSVIFTGYVDRDLKKTWFSAADAFVLPSTDDSFSVSVIEAAATGLHCLLSPYVGAAEYLNKHQEQIAELTENDWARVITDFAQQSKPRHEPTGNWYEQFSIEHVGKSWLDIYKQISSQQS